VVVIVCEVLVVSGGVVVMGCGELIGGGGLRGRMMCGGCGLMLDIGL